jgi:hypothetical protein
MGLEATESFTCHGKVAVDPKKAEKTGFIAAAGEIVLLFKRLFHSHANHPFFLGELILNSGIHAHETNNCRCQQ